MGKTTLIIVAILALLLISGVAIARYKGFCNGPEGRISWVTERLGKKLDLDETQRTQLTQLKDQTLDIMQEMRDERESTAETTIALLDSPTLDREQARQLVAEKQTQLASAADQLIDVFADFSDNLRDDQRSKLQEMIQHHRDRRHCGFCNRSETATQN
ncbi:MAG: periplasmic heavy metal sensor [Candidatus Thiodiazotropha sp. (ex Notomyrtea botanica)]|nr:periplasmic heavy metal sensor [Candidatus Thiodiazotropha sp. (ex Notomyrtea botanica)]